MEGIFLVFAMNNVVSIPIHTLLMSAGTLLPIISVVCILAFSISTNEQVPSSEKNKEEIKKQEEPKGVEKYCREQEKQLERA